MKGEINMKHVKTGILLLFLCLGVAACCSFASYAEQVTMTVTAYSDDSLTVAVIGEADIQVQACIIAAAYNEDMRLNDVKVREIVLTGNKQYLSFSISLAADNIKVFALNKETLQPLCAPLDIKKQRYTVSFENEIGELIDRQTVIHGMPAALPAIPVRNGYVFQKWSSDVSSVMDDMVVTPLFVENTAPNIFEIVGAEGSVGDEITVYVCLRGTVALCGFDMRLLFDTDCLEYIDIDSEYAFDVIAHYVASSNTIRFNFSSSRNKTIGGTIFAVHFRIKDTLRPDCLLKLSPIEVIRTDSQTTGNLFVADYTTTEGIVYIR